MTTTTTTTRLQETVDEKDVAWERRHASSSLQLLLDGLHGLELRVFRRSLSASTTRTHAFFCSFVIPFSWTSFSSLQWATSCLPSTVARCYRCVLHLIKWSGVVHSAFGGTRMCPFSSCIHGKRKPAPWGSLEWRYPEGALRAFPLGGGLRG